MKKIKTSLAAAFAATVFAGGHVLAADPALENYSPGVQDHLKVSAIIDEPAKCRIIQTQDGDQEYRDYRIYNYDRQSYRFIQIGEILEKGIRIDKEQPLSDKDLFGASEATVERMRRLAGISCLDSAAVKVRVTSENCEVTEQIADANRNFYRRYDFSQGTLIVSGKGVAPLKKTFDEMSDFERARAARIEDLIPACENPKSRHNPKKIPGA